VVEVDDDDEEAKAAAEAQRDVELRAAEVRVKAAAKAAEQATHWAAEMDKALAYRRDVDRSTAAQREAARRADTEHHIERHMTVRCQEAAIHAAMVALGRQRQLQQRWSCPCGRETAAVAT
jgi:hypothetical protein